MKNKDNLLLDNKSATIIFILFVNTLYFSGCSVKVLPTYTGSKRSTGEMSILTGILPTYLLKFDGKSGPNGKGTSLKSQRDSYLSFGSDRFAIELEPGIHELLIQYRYSDVKIKSIGGGFGYTTIKTQPIFAEYMPFKISFIFEPGKIYELQINVQDKSVLIYEIEKIPCRICGGPSSPFGYNPPPPLPGTTREIKY